MTTSPLENYVQPPDQPQVRDLERFSGHLVRLQLFEGPLDLLLYLIRAHRYDIFDIPIHDVTKQFMEFIKIMDELDLEYAGDFLVTAATLMQIKSRMLLPQKESENEEELAEEERDPREELVARLLEYQQMQEAAKTLEVMRDERSQMFPRPPDAPAVPADEAAPPEETPAEQLLLQDVSTFDLLHALQKVLQRLAERPVALVHREPFTLGDRMRGLAGRIRHAAGGLTFGDLCEDCQSRLEIVITFLAVLELIRRGRARMTQKALFDEIWVAATTRED